MSDHRAVTIARKFVREVGREFPVERAYLFGSFAKRKADENSDIDVCVVSKAFGKDYFGEEMRLRSLSVRVDPRLSPVAFNPEDLRDPYSQLADEILRHGVQL